MWKRRGDGVHLINLGKTWEKLMLAARVIASVENPGDECPEFSLTAPQPSGVSNLNDSFERKRLLLPFIPHHYSNNTIQ